MEALFTLADKFAVFVRDDLVPFFTVVPDRLGFPYYNLLDAAWDTATVRWPFDYSMGEFILIYGVTGMLVYRLVKFFTDIIF